MSMFRSLLMAGGGPGYVPGMLMHLDGIDNVGSGSLDTAATTWKDLTGNGFDAVPRNPRAVLLWSENGGLLGDGRDRILKVADGLSPLTGCTEFTIELAYYLPGKGSAWWLNNRNPWNTSATTGFQVYTWNSTGINVACMSGPGNPQWIIPVSSATSYHTIAFTYANGTAAVYTDGSFAGAEAVRMTQEQIENTPFYVNGVEGGGFSMSEGFRILGVRIYPRALESGELAVNAALDQARYFN